MNSEDAVLLLEIRNLNISYQSKKDSFHVLRGVDLEIQKGEIIAIVGETGSGKTSLARALLNINPDNATTTFDNIIFHSDEKISITELNGLNELRGSHISMLFQEPTLFLNPIMKCGNQIMESILLDKARDKNASKEIIMDALSDVGFNDPERIYRSFPNQLSGGECQRVMLVMATIRNPCLLIADEPTSSVDFETRKKVFDHFNFLVEAKGMSVILITHDLQLALEHSDRLYVMHEGQIVDMIKTKDFSSSLKSDYTDKLFQSNYKISESPKEDVKKEDNLFIEVNDLNVFHSSSGGRSLFFNKRKHAVKNVTLLINKGETLGILGESGSGKTSLAWALSGLINIDSGSIDFSQHIRQADIQMVFQNPGLALSPKQKVGAAVEEVILANKKKYECAISDELTKEYFEMVGLDLSLMARLPHQLSGGEKQRVCIAKALATKPQLIIFDEAVSSLDASVKIEILNLLIDLKHNTNLTYIFISHDRAVIHYVADRVMVMEDGRLSVLEYSNSMI